MYQNYMNKPTFMNNTGSTGFGASTSTFGQPAANTSMFSSIQPSTIFPTPSTSSFNAGPSTQSTFATKKFKKSGKKPLLDEPPKLDLSLLKFTGGASYYGNVSAPASPTIPVSSPLPAAPHAPVGRPTRFSPYIPPLHLGFDEQSYGKAVDLYTNPQPGPSGLQPFKSKSTHANDSWEDIYDVVTSDNNTLISPAFSSKSSTPRRSKASKSSSPRHFKSSKHSSPRYSKPSKSSSPRYSRPNSPTLSCLQSSKSTIGLGPSQLSTSKMESMSIVFSSQSSTTIIESMSVVVSPQSSISKMDTMSVVFSPQPSTSQMESMSFVDIIKESQQTFEDDFDMDDPDPLTTLFSRKHSLGMLNRQLTTYMNASNIQILRPANNSSVPVSFPFNALSGSNLFGQQPQPSTSGLFGSSNAFGQNKTTFGFGSTPTQTSGLFGQQPQQQTGTGLFQSTTPNLFASSGFGSQTTGTVIKFSPVTGTDTMQKNGVTQSISTKHHCITCMKEYENKSLEELRFEDYSCNRKGPQQQTGFGTTPFGTATSGTTASLFGQTDNKQAFGQPQGFGQGPTFGQTTPAFGVTNQSTTTSLFGKPNTFGATTSATPSFGFNAPPVSSNPFSANQNQKHFTQPLFGNATTQAQPAFGTGAFGQPSTQNTTTNLFQKPAQPTSGFNTGPQGFSFNQPSTTQSSNLFQGSKLNTGFSIFGQPNAAPGFGQATQPTQPTFGTNFGKLTQPTFTQPSQPAFGTNMSGGIQQPTLFGNTTSKPPNLFGSTTGGGLFANNVFQQTPATFSLNMNQPQPLQFPPEHADISKNITLVATDAFPEGPHIYGLEPLSSGSRKTTTNPQDIKALLDYSKKKETMTGVGTKMRVRPPTPRRGTNYNQEFFETNNCFKNSPKCLVIRKFKEETSTVYSKYNNELLEEVECMQREAEADAMENNGENKDAVAELTENRNVNLRLEFDPTYGEEETIPIFENKSFSYSRITLDTWSSKTSSRHSLDLKPSLDARPSLDDANGNAIGSQEEEEEEKEGGGGGGEGEGEETRVVESRTELPATPSVNKELEVVENPAGVILTRPEYYMYPALKDLHHYIDDNGECIVKGLTVGRKGYGNVYFPDPINITNMNLDEIVHFRHREIIIYPDDTKKPPIGEGLNRKAQVTLDKVFPREKGTSNYLTDVNQIIETNFVENLMHITQKHNSRFVDYRPETGSWVFKVKHFSKYSFTDSDEEECEVSLEAVAAIKSQHTLNQPESIEMEEASIFGLGGSLSSKSRTILNESNSLLRLTNHTLDFWREQPYMFDETLFHKDSMLQTLKSSLFTNLDTILEKEETKVTVIKQLEAPCEVMTTPRVRKLPDITLSPKKLFTSHRCYVELGIFKSNAYKIGWSKGFHFYNTYPFADNEVVYALTHYSMNTESSEFYNIMMPNLSEMLQIVLEESDFTLDKNQIPTLHIKKGPIYLKRQTDLFNEHAKDKALTGRAKYLKSVWNLCSALWGPGDNCPCSRRQLVSDWLKKVACDWSDDWRVGEYVDFAEKEAFKTIFTLLSFHKISEACEFASKNNLNQLSLLISQMSANQRVKYWMKKYIDNFVWKEQGVILDEYKKLYLLLSGIPVYETINTCDYLDWMRCFGLHLWYIAPSSAPIKDAFDCYKKAFEEAEYAAKPIPPYCNAESKTKEYDMLYHILALYVDSTYQLCKVLHPGTHTENITDYRFSWVILQLFLSLEVGLVRESEKDHLHTMFSTQLENMGLWKWAVFVLLFLENNVLKKNLLMKIFDRNLSTCASTSQVENELVKTFKIPRSWIHEVKATKAKLDGHYYDYFHHALYMEDWKQANNTFVEHILPELFINEQYDYLSSFIKKLEPAANTIVNWNIETGLIKEYFELHDALSGKNEEEAFVIGKMSSLFRRINCFPVKNDQQKLYVAELSRKCALLFKLIYANIDSSSQAKVVDVLNNLLMPPDLRHHELMFVISK